MRSRNPILRNNAAFNGQFKGQDAAAYGHEQYPASGVGYEGYAETRTALVQPMTIDSVIAKTALTLFLVVASAALTWIFLPDGTAAGEANYVAPAWIGGALVGAGLGLVLSFRRTISPPLVVLYALVEGIFLGAMSEWFERYVYSGVVIEAVLGTTAAFLATLAAYKLLHITVNAGFRRWLGIFGMGFFVVVLGDFLISLFGTEIGFNGLGPLGLLMSFVGLGLGVAYLIADFDMIERGVAAGAPEVESWRAAFALTAALVLIYIELVRILGIVQRS